MRRWAFGILFLVSQASAQSVTWLDLYPQFKYTDLVTACQVASLSPFTIAVEATDDLKIVRVNSRPGLVMFASDILWWTPEEAAGLVLEKDAKDRVWIRDLKLNARLVDWMMRNLGTGIGAHCPPQESVATVGPSPYTYAFEREFIEGGPRFAQQAKFSGRRRNGYAYELWLGWEQRPHRPRGLSSPPAPTTPCSRFRATCLGR